MGYSVDVDDFLRVFESMLHNFKYSQYYNIAFKIDIVRTVWNLILKF